jgi:hypothetical protein
MKTARRGILLLLPVSLAIAASAPLDRLPRNAAGDAVRKGIAYAGGWDAWSAKKTVAFRKTVRRFKPDGSVEFTRVELHRYRLQPFASRMEMEVDGHKTVYVNDGNRAAKFLDGKEMTAQADVNSARNNTFGSHYVFGMPFKLTDSGAHLEPAGKEKLADGTVAEKVRVSYEKGAGDAGGLHTWTYYFDSKSGRLCANHLTYGPEQYDYTEYHDDKTVDGLRLSTRRLGYKADARGKKGSPFSEIRYDEIRFDGDMPGTLFALAPLPPR